MLILIFSISLVLVINKLLLKIISTIFIFCNSSILSLNSTYFIYIRFIKSICSLFFSYNSLNSDNFLFLLVNISFNLLNCCSSILFSLQLTSNKLFISSISSSDNTNSFEGNWLLISLISGYLSILLINNSNSFNE